MTTRIITTTAAAIIFSFNLGAQNGDCPGEAVCTDQTENMISGSVNELNVANRGCLTSNEATSSYWYQICVSTNGTIEFAINPNGANNDYDFAVWGPGAACPPTTPPLRCSYAATPFGGGPNGDMTGLGNGALDNTENASGNGWVAPIVALAGQCFVINVNNYAGGSSTFFIDFNGTAGLSCSILPVELSSFSCSTIENGIEINWSCHTETNNSHFILERGSDGVTFDFVARIEGSGTTSQPTYYSYVDLSAPAGTSYYRLRQVDYNGHETTYGPIACEYLSVGISIMEITDMSGQLVFRGETTSYSETINEQYLAEGVYVVVLRQGNSQQVFKYAVVDTNPDAH